MLEKEKKEKFYKVSERRLNAIIKDLRLLGNCSRKATYKYSKNQVDRIFGKIEEETEKAKYRFVHPNAVGYSGFCFSGPDDNECIIHTFPNGVSVKAVICDDNNFPAINLIYCGDDGEEHIMCFVEFNPDKNEEEPLCVGTYKGVDDDEETAYYDNFKTKS